MPLESTIICLDNSDWMRNGDYIPTRLSAQQDAASLICTQRTDSHPESTVGLLTMAGNGVEVLVSPTENIGKILATFANIKSEGQTELATAVSIAQLALRHRKNKNGGQRIIIFIGSPVSSDEKELKKVGSLLKKNNIAVDVVVMGEHDVVQQKMQELVNAANANDNSHLIIVPPGVQPSDALISSPIFQGESVGGGSGTDGDYGGYGGSGGGGDMFAEYGGVDPSLDPELAMVMRASAEEARQQEEARLQAAAKQSEESKGSDETKESADSKSEESKPDQSSSDKESKPQQSSSESSKSGGEVDGNEDDDEALLQAALAISLQDSNNKESQEQGHGQAHDNDDNEVDDDEMDEEMRLALAMSMEDAKVEDKSSSGTSGSSSSSDAPAVLLDQDFVSQLLGSVEVDKDDPLIQAALQQLQSEGKASGNDKKDAGDNDDKSSGKKRKEDDR